MAPKIVIAGARGVGLAAQIAEVLGDLDAVMVDGDDPLVRAVEMRPEEDFHIPTTREFYLGGGRTRGTKRTDIPRPKDQYRQRKGRKS